MSKIYIFIAEGFEEVEALAPFDILKRAGNNVFLVGLNDKYVSSTHNLKIETDFLLRDINDLADAIVLPGGIPGSINLSNNEKLLKIIENHYISGKIIASICAAPALVLTKFDFFKDKDATCYPSYIKELEKVANFVDSEVVISDNIITATSSGQSIKFGLAIVEKLNGINKYNDVKKGMCIK